MLISVFLIILGAVYEMFSHEVYSFYMIYAFMIPLAGGAFPYLIRGIRGRRPLRHGAQSLYHAGIATLTTGCVLKGALDIYGTTNRLLYIYLLTGSLLILTGFILTSPLLSAAKERRT